MTSYLDSSVILRVILGQRGRLREWKSIDRPVASALAEVECLRTLDRLRIAETVSDRDIAARREAVFRLLGSCEVIELGRPVLERAAQPLPTTLGTLDAIHLASAMLWRDRSGEDIIMATHDQSLGLAAQAVGLTVIGLPA